MVGAVILGGAATLGGYFLLADAPGQITIVQEKPVIPARLAGLTETTQEDFIEAADRTLNAVVHVKTAVEQKYQANPFEQFFFGAPSSPRSQMVMGSGSGVIFTPSG